VKRAFLFVLLAACHSKTSVVADAGSAPVASSSANVGEDEEEEALAQPDGGPCPQPIRPNYCRGRCRNFVNRQFTGHARRVSDPERHAFGKCDTFDVFAEDEREGDGGVVEGIIEYFDPTGTLVGAVDTRQKSCTQFGAVPTCTPKLEWRRSDVLKMKFGPIVTTRGLPPEVISRIVRTHYGRFRQCAEMRVVGFDGRYAVKLHIAKGGEVSSVEDDGTTIKDPAVATCFRQAYQALSFPEPEGGPMVAQVSIELGHPH
jgi:hypothetical protein